MEAMLQLQFSKRAIALPSNAGQLVPSPKVDHVAQLTLGSKRIIYVRYGSSLLGYLQNQTQNQTTWELIWEELIFTTQQATYNPEKYPLLVTTLDQGGGSSQEVIILRHQEGIKFFRQVETNGKITLELLSTDPAFGDIYDWNQPESTFLWGRFFPNGQLLGLFTRKKDGRVKFYSVLKDRLFSKQDSPMGSFNARLVLDPIWSQSATKFFISDVQAIDSATGSRAGTSSQVIGLQTSGGLHFYQFNKSYKLVKIETGLNLQPSSLSNSSKFYTLNKGQDENNPDFVKCDQNGLTIHSYSEPSKTYRLSHQQNKGVTSLNCDFVQLLDINGDKKDDIIATGQGGLTALSTYGSEPKANGAQWASILNVDNLVGQERYIEPVGTIKSPPITIFFFDHASKCIRHAQVRSYAASGRDSVPDQGQEIEGINDFIPTQLMNTLPPHKGTSLPIPLGSIEAPYYNQDGSTRTRTTLRWLEQWGDDTVLGDALAVANGHAQFSIPLVSTATERGLGFQLTMFYSSQHAGLPSDLLGAGWMLPLGLDRITVDYTGDGISPSYTVHAGTESMPLKEISKTNNVIKFEQDKQPGVICTFYKGHGSNIEEEYWVIESEKERTVYGNAAHSVQRSLSWPHWKGAGREWDTLVPVSSAWYLTEHHSKVSNSSLHYTYQSETRSIRAGKGVTASIRLLKIQDDQEATTKLTFTYSPKNQAETNTIEIPDEEGNIRFSPHMAQTHYITQLNLLSPKNLQVLQLKYSLDGSTRLLKGLSQLIHSQEEMIFNFDYETHKERHLLANATFGRGLHMRYRFENRPHLSCPPLHPPLQRYPVPEVPTISYGPDFVVLAHRIKELVQNSEGSEKTVDITLRVLDERQAKVLFETSISKGILQGQGIQSYGLNSFKDYFIILMNTEESSKKIMSAFSRSNGTWAEVPAHIKTWKYPDNSIFRQAESLIVIADPTTSNLKIFDFQSELPDPWKETSVPMTSPVLRLVIQNPNRIWTYDDRQLKVLTRQCLTDSWAIKVVSGDVAGLVTKERDLLRSLDLAPGITKHLVDAFTQDGLQVAGNTVLLTAIEMQGTVLHAFLTMLLLDEERNVIKTSRHRIPRDNLLNLTYDFENMESTFVLHYVPNPSDTSKFQVRIKSISGKVIKDIEELGNKNKRADALEQRIKDLNEAEGYKTFFMNNVLFSWETNYRSALTAEGVQSGEKTFLRMTGTQWSQESLPQSANNDVKLGKKFSLETRISKSKTDYTLYRGENGGKTVVKRMLTRDGGQLINAFPHYIAWQDGSSTMVLTFKGRDRIGPEFKYENEKLLPQSSVGNLLSFKNLTSSIAVQSHAQGYELVSRPTWSILQDSGQPLIRNVDLSFGNLRRSTSYERSFEFQRHSNQIDDTCVEILSTIPGGNKTISGWEEQSVTHHYLGIGNSKNVTRTQKWFNKNGIQVFQPPDREDQKQNSQEEDEEEETPLQKDGRVKDKSGELVIADFVPFSVKEGAVGYVGFESYEQPAPQWKFSNSSIIKNRFSLTGQNFLRLRSGSLDFLEGNFKPAESRLPYVISAWLRFFSVRPDSTNINANITKPDDLQVGTSVRWFKARVRQTISNPTREESRDIIGEVKRRDGDWTYVEILINGENLNEANIADSDQVLTSIITVLAGRDLAPSMVLDIDHIRVAPLVHEFAATVYDDQTQDQTAAIESNGLITRNFIHGGAIIGNVKNDGQLERFVRSTKVNSIFPALSSEIPPQQKSSTITFVPQSGFYESFDPFAIRTRWLISKGEESVWTNSPGELWHKNRNSHTIEADTRIFNLQSAGVRCIIGLLEVQSGFQINWEYWTLQLNRQSDQFVSLSLKSTTDDRASALLTISQLPSYAEYIVVLENERIFVWLEGILLVDRQLPLPADLKKEGGATATTTPWASFSFTARGSTLLKDCLFMNRPSIRVEYQNPLGDKTQVIQLETQNTAFITETLFDLVGRGDIRTKMTRITRNATQPLLAYQPNFVAANDRDPTRTNSVRETGRLKGEVNDLNSIDDGVAYFRTLFDDSPLNIETVAGLPGKDFGITGRYSKRLEKQSNIPFLANHFPYSLGFVQKTERVPGGVLHVSVFDQNKNRVAIYTQTQGFDHHLTTNEYDDHQRVVKILPPMYHQMADTFSNTKPWQPGESRLSEEEKELQRELGTFLTYNAEGILETKVTPDGGRATYFFNQDKQVRFTIFEDGALSNNSKVVTYLEYDERAVLSRSGYFTDAPPVHQLTAAALNSTTTSLQNEVDYQNFLTSNEEAEPTERGRFRYFFTANSNGTLAEQLSFNSDQTMEIKISTDLPGMQDEQPLNATKINREYQGGRLFSMEYPALVDGKPFRLTHQYNRQGQLVGLGIPGRSSHLAQFQYHPSGHISSETHLPGSAQNFTRIFHYNSPGFLETIADPFLTQELDYTSQGYGQDGHGDGSIMRSTFTAAWSDNVDRREFQIKDDQIAGYQFSTECVRALKRLGFVSSGGIPSNNKQFYSVGTANQLPLVCEGKIVSQIAHILAEKQLPKTSGYAYAYGNHGQLVRAKYFTGHENSPQTISIEPLQQNSFTEIPGINSTLSKEIWRKLVESGHILIDQRKYDPNDAYLSAVGKPGKMLVAEGSLRKDLEGLNSDYTKYAHSISELLLKYFSEGASLTHIDFEKVFLDWEKITDTLITVPALVVQGLRSEARKIFEMLLAKQYTSTSTATATVLDSSLRSTFANLTAQLPGILCVLKRHFSTGLGTHPFDMESYDIDPNGNHRHFYNGFDRFELEYRNKTNQITAITLDSPWKSQLRNRYLMEHDFRGNVIRAMHKGIRRLTYHPMSQRTTRIELEDGRSLQLHYDYHGERILKQVKNSDSAVEQEIYYIRDEQGRVLMDRVTDFTTGRATLRSTTIYIYGPRGLLGFLRNDKFHSVITDHAGSPRLVVRDGVVVAAYDYHPYGLPIKKYEASTEASLRYLFTGQEWDAEAGLYNYHARLYDPSIGRFYQIDPQAQYFSPYKYAGNSPVSLVDPDGEFALTTFLIVAAFAAIGAYIGASAANNRWNPADWDFNSSGTYIGFFGGALAGGILPIGFAASTVAVAGIGVVAATGYGTAIGIGVVTTLGIGGAYLTGAVAQGWDLTEWKWTRPGIYNSLFEGFGLGSGFIGGIKAPIHFAKETFGKGTLGAKVFVSVSFATGISAAYAKTAFANKEAFFWNWDYKNPATYGSLVVGFNSGYSWPQGFVAIKSSFSFAGTKEYLNSLAKVKGSLSNWRLLKHIVSDGKGPVFQLLVSAGVGYVVTAQANNNSFNPGNWDWKSFDTYEAILNGNTMASDVSSLLSYIKAKGVRSYNNHQGYRFARKTLGVQNVSPFKIQWKLTWFDSPKTSFRNQIIRSINNANAGRKPRHAQSYDPISSLESLLQTSIASRPPSLLAQIFAVPVHLAYQLSSATVNMAELIMEEVRELPLRIKCPQSHMELPFLMESDGHLSLMEPKSEPSSWVENCVPWVMSPNGNYNRNAITCYASEGTAFVFPYQSTSAHRTSADFNTDRFKSCRPLTFNGRPSVGCDGEESYLIYTPNQTARPFEMLDGNIMLASVLPSAMKHISSAISWFAGAVLGNNSGTDQGSLSTSSRFISTEEKVTWARRVQEMAQLIGTCNGNNDGGCGSDLNWAMPLLEDMQEDFGEIFAEKSQVSTGWIAGAEVIDVFLEKLEALEEDVAEMTLFIPESCYGIYMQSDDGTHDELATSNSNHTGKGIFGGKEKLNFLETKSSLNRGYHQQIYFPGNKSFQPVPVIDNCRRTYLSINS